MRFKDLAIEMTVSIVTDRNGKFVGGRTTHPVACFGKPEVSFEKLRVQPEDYRALIEAAEQAGHGNILRIHVDGEVELAHTTTASWQNHAFHFILIVDNIYDAFQVK